MLCHWGNCSLEQVGEYELWIHMQQAHLKRPPISRDQKEISCNWFHQQVTCEKKFMHLGHLKDHVLANHFSKQLHLFNCMKCGLMFKNRIQLYRHKSKCTEIALVDINVDNQRLIAVDTPYIPFYQNNTINLADISRPPLYAFDSGILDMEAVFWG
jgi:hypothetical protein